MNLDALVRSFSTGTYVVTRRQAVPMARGVSQPTIDTTFSIVASVQPASGRDLLRLPEGRRSNETRVLFTVTELKTGDAGEPFEADVVTIDGDPWEVQHVEDWVQAMAAGAAFRCIAQRPGAQ